MKIKKSKLDKLFSRYIKARDKVCQRCDGKTGLQCSHYHSRRKRSVRWDEDNACLLCFGCHIYFHGEPLKATEFWKKRLGKKIFEIVNIRAENVHKMDLAAVGLYLKAKLKEIDG